MRIVVTGATGKIGKALVSKLAEQNLYSVSAITRHEITDTDPRVHWIRANLDSSENCDAVVRDQDVIIHLAWSGAPLKPNSTSTAHDIDDNLFPTLRLLDAIKRSERCPHVVFCSSGGTVYGASKERRPFTELDACFPVGAYAIQKFAAERFLATFAAEGALTTTILRVATVYGNLVDKDAVQGFIGTAMSRALSGEPIRLIGNPNNVRDYVHIDDVLGAICKACERRGHIDLFNVGSGIGTSVLDVVAQIEIALRRPVSVFEEYREEASLLLDWSILDICRIQEQIGWQPTTSLATGIRSLAEQWARSRG